MFGIERLKALLGSKPDPATPLPKASETPQTSEALRTLADCSDRRAAALNIDPPREGRKSYAERQSETRQMSTSDIRALIREREAQGKQCGVLYRTLSERGGDD